MPEQNEQESLDAKFEAAIEADDNEAAAELLSQVEDAPSDGAALFTDEALGLGGFDPVLAQLSLEQIAALQIQVPNKDDLSAMYLPGTSVIDSGHRLHLTNRGDVKRAARGLAIAAAGGVDLDSKVIMSNSGRQYTIENGECMELTKTEQPDFEGNVAVLVQKIACKGHLEYASNGSGLTGGSHVRCLHQWALMFKFGYYVTASTKGFFSPEKPIIQTEIANRVGDESARAVAQAQITQWTQNSSDRRDVRTGFAQAINAEKNELGLAEGSYLPPKTEIGAYDLPTGETVSEAITSLKGRQFALTVRLPMNDKTIDITTRTVKNLTELASVVAPHFAVARQNNGALLALELIAR